MRWEVDERYEIHEYDKEAEPSSATAKIAIINISSSPTKALPSVDLAASKEEDDERRTVWLDVGSLSCRLAMIAGGAPGSRRMAPTETCSSAEFDSFGSAGWWLSRDLMPKGAGFWAAESRFGLVGIVEVFIDIGGIRDQLCQVQFWDSTSRVLEIAITKLEAFYAGLSMSAA